MSKTPGPGGYNSKSLELSMIRRSSAYGFPKNKRFHLVNSKKNFPGPGDYKWNDHSPKRGGFLSTNPTNNGYSLSKGKRAQVYFF